MNRQNRIVLEAPAKLNLFLDITGRLPNGYHSIDTLMQAVDLSDVIVVGRRPGSELAVTCSRPGIPLGEENIVHRAAQVFFESAELPEEGLSIHIDKAIPAGAGLGGGSADAAAVLVGLNELFSANMTTERLCEFGLRIGADVPFLIQGGLARAEGIGEKLTPIPQALPPCALVIAKPEVGVNTAEAFAAYDKGRDIVHTSSGEILAALAAEDLKRIANSLFNVFERLSPIPQVEKLVAAMRANGALGSAMTGSGSAVFGIFADETSAQSCLDGLVHSGVNAVLAKPANYGARILHRS